MDTLIRINAQTAGRDKIARLLQYLSRALWHRLQQSNKNGVNGLKNLEFQLSSFRKLLRLGKCIDVLYSITSLWKYPDPTVRYTVIISRICTSLFLLADHILWFSRADICNVNTNKWSHFANKYWMYSILLNLIRDLYEIYNIIKQQRCSILPPKGVQNVNDLYKVFTNISKLAYINRNVVIDTVRNGCDIFIPLTAMGRTKLSPGTIGLLGVVSSIAGLLVLIEPISKLPMA